MAKTTEARQRILGAALDLFHAQGVAATGLDQILKASGTGKGQFYHYFSSKDDLVLEVMREFRRRIVEGETALKTELRTWKDLEDWFGFFLDAQTRGQCLRSCPIGTIGAELGEEQAALREEARAIFGAAKGVLGDFFGRMKREGKLSRGVDPVALADFCYTIMQGGLLVAKIERRIEPFENAVKHALRHVKSLRA
ncbi:MAG: TetR/AcrR family transcriptional regulator [Planctomycetota bacterium]